ncbi:hypothetical protein [Xenorhabdus bovienii]|nr:hypothetical protein [Xenorhabdus bovienii]
MRDTPSPTLDIALQGMPNRYISTTQSEGFLTAKEQGLQPVKLNLPVNRR